MIDFRKLVQAGVHFGHQAARWVPKMSPYIWGVKNKVHLIDVSKTAYQLEKAARFLQEVASEGKQILWVGTKKPARNVIQEVATKLGMPYVNHRWVGGTLSNYSQVKKSVTRLLHYEDVLEKSEKYPHYTKKELNEIKKSVDRLAGIVGGIRTLTWPVGAIVLVDVNKEQSALKEAVKVGVPVVALVDTNADPSLVDYVIPANDDAPRSIAVILEYLQQAVEEGRQQATRKTEKVKAAMPQAPAAKPEEQDVILQLAEVEAALAEESDQDGASKKEAKKVRAVAVAKSVKKEAQKEKGVLPAKLKKS
jgi:small subunit ribosomal protein S2